MHRPRISAPSGAARSAILSCMEASAPSAADHRRDLRHLPRGRARRRLPLRPRVPGRARRDRRHRPEDGRADRRPADHRTRGAARRRPGRDARPAVRPALRPLLRGPRRSSGVVLYGLVAGVLFGAVVRRHRPGGPGRPPRLRLGRGRCRPSATSSRSTTRSRPRPSSCSRSCPPRLDRGGGERRPRRGPRPGRDHRRGLLRDRDGGPAARRRDRRLLRPRARRRARRHLARQHLSRAVSATSPRRSTRSRSRPNPDWSRVYPLQTEIRDYLRRFADERGVVPHIRFGHELQGAAWDDDAKRLAARDLARASSPRTSSSAAMGGLSEPAAPRDPRARPLRGDDVPLRRAGTTTTT